MLNKNTQGLGYKNVGPIRSRCSYSGMSSKYFIYINYSCITQCTIQFCLTIFLTLLVFYLSFIPTTTPHLTSHPPTCPWLLFSGMCDAVKGWPSDKIKENCETNPKVHCIMLLSLSYEAFRWHPLNEKLQLAGQLVKLCSYLCTLPIAS